MGIFDGCLLACDIDGTLISGELLPERNVEKIEYFVSEGGAFSLATGRTAAALSMITSKIKNISPSVLSNGCVIYDFKSNKPLMQKCLSKNLLNMVKDVIEQCSIGIEMHSADKIFVPSRSAASDLHESFELMTAEFISADEALGYDINKIIYFVEKEEQYEMLEKLAQKYNGMCTFYRTCTFIGGVKQNYYEQIPTGVSKADALLELSKMLGIKKGGFFAIGDYYNDVPMLEAADISAVPKEAPNDVKKTADKVVGTVSNGAVADFIEYLEVRQRDGQANKTQSAKNSV
ncbi:MAG: HAD-IIB family hydrolase [Clostridia bacterium]|nr:HAD-IIB family hydrolase [Clostridia bacterium]